MSSLLPSWKFKNGRIPYNKLDKRGVLLASYHCIDLINKNFKMMHFWQYKENVAMNDEWRFKFEERKQKCASFLEYYSKQMKHLDKRAEELGFSLPDDKIEVSNLLKSEFPIEKEKAF